MSIDDSADLRPVCISFPTIMSGLVLRWYADQDAWETDDELANAGRESATFKKPVTDELRQEVQAAHEYIKTAQRFGYWSAPLDVSRWVTHRPVSFLGSELELVSS